jgi:hypothetical protein
MVNKLKKEFTMLRFNKFDLACLPPRFAKLPDEWAMKRRWRNILSGGFATFVLLAS